MEFSINAFPYNIDEMRRNPRYAAKFTTGWSRLNTRDPVFVKAVLTTHVWSPIIFDGERRRQDAFVRAQLLVLDFDSPEYPLDQCIREWCDTIHWIGTTRNHQREKRGVTCDRFRLVAPFERVITDPEEFTYNHQVQIERYGADPIPKDKARLYYPCREIVSTNLEGYFVDVLTVPDHLRAQNASAIAQSVRLGANGVVPRWARALVNEAIPVGKRNDAWFRFGAAMGRAGFAYDQVLRLILSSKTYEGAVVSQVLLNEIRECSGSGYKRGCREVETPDINSS